MDGRAIMCAVRDRPGEKMTDRLEQKIARALEARAGLFDGRHESAFRLFNGFTEGDPDFCVDLYAGTLVLHDYSESGIDLDRVAGFYLDRLPWITAVVLKPRESADPETRNGMLIHGVSPAPSIREHGVRYAVDLLLNRDCSLYLDTRNLRRWELDHLGGKRVLNTFAYTGSLGVAAAVAGASRVVHLDLNRRFLNLAKTSYTLNGLPIDKRDFVAGDFWPKVSAMIREELQFDCVLLDPPFFAKTSKGIVDMQNNYARLINKVRPLIAHGGRLVAVNNALYVSGRDFMKTLEGLCLDGYLEIEELIPVGEDFTGYDSTRVPSNIISPAPFNHSTKIAVLRVKRKDALELPGPAV